MEWFIRRPFHHLPDTIHFDMSKAFERSLVIHDVTICGTHICTSATSTTTHTHTTAFKNSMHKIPMVNFYSQPRHEQQQPKIKMFSMAHHKCQVTVLLHDRVMVTAFKLNQKK